MNESNVSAIFAVLSNGVGMIHHRQKYKINMDEPVRSNTIEKAKKKNSRGWDALLAHGLKPCTAQNNKYR